MHLCPGNQDFPDLVQHKFDFQETCFKDQTGQLTRAYIQHPNVIDQNYIFTIRAVNCDLAIQTPQKSCLGCSKHRQTLNQIRATNKARSSKDNEDYNKTTKQQKQQTKQTTAS